ncbi:Hypothetical predicted protein [Podarcis lilfordi]|uniref:Uncharacterized protein n=1 Tax=Podarcis lilfordi TaxID=74358 RepID=A0AA35KNM6_9SAUR|nr:Hypothetical predicted protein [Podarcis lilfordi]
MFKKNESPLRQAISHFAPFILQTLVGLALVVVHNDALHRRTAAGAHLFSRPTSDWEKFFNLANKLKPLLEMTGEPDEIVLSIGKQNCNQADMISSWPDHANAERRNTGKCI